MKEQNKTILLIVGILIIVFTLSSLNIFSSSFSVIPATGRGAANQQCTFIADLNPNYFSTWRCEMFADVHWISYDINNDGTKEKFGKWISASQNLGDYCDTQYPTAAKLSIPGIDNMDVRYGKQYTDSPTAPNKLLICCGSDAWGFIEGKGAYDQAVTTCPPYNPTNCTPNWVVGTWGECFNSIQSRNVVDSNQCGITLGKPATQQACTVLPTCTAANYQYALMPSTCPSNQQQTKIWTQVSACEGGVSRPANEVVSCTYNPGCTPDNSCAANTCTGSTCTNNCGNVISGTKTTGTCSLIDEQEQEQDTEPSQNFIDKYLWWIVGAIALVIVIMLLKK